MKKLLVASILSLSILITGCFGNSSTSTDTVSINIPNELVFISDSLLSEDGSTIDETKLEEFKTKNSITVISTNSDSSIDISLSPEGLENLKKEYESELANLINQILETNNYKDISYNTDFNEFIVYTNDDTTELPENSQVIVDLLINNGNVYQILSNKDTSSTKITVSFLNTNDEVIASFDSEGNETYSNLANTDEEVNSEVTE